MRSGDEAFNAARDEIPFSNGTEGYGWMGAWCDRCVHDKPARQGREQDGCPLLLVALCGLTPSEWIPGDPHKPGGFSIAEQYTCIEFRGEDEGGDPEPKPTPTPPGQLELVAREPYTGVRMFVQPAEVAESVSAR